MHCVSITYTKRKWTEVRTTQLKQTRANRELLPLEKTPVFRYNRLEVVEGLYGEIFLTSIGNWKPSFTTR